MRYFLDTNVLSGLVRAPQGQLAAKIGEVGEASVYTSIIVAAELRFGAAKKGSNRLSQQVEAVLAALDVAAYAEPAERRYGDIRRHLERIGMPIGGNDLLIASHALCDGSVLVTDNVGEFLRVPGLRVENWVER